MFGKEEWGWSIAKSIRNVCPTSLEVFKPITNPEKWRPGHFLMGTYIFDTLSVFSPGFPGLDVPHLHICVLMLFIWYFVVHSSDGKLYNTCSGGTLPELLHYCLRWGVARVETSQCEFIFVITWRSCDVQILPITSVLCVQQQCVPIFVITWRSSSTDAQSLVKRPPQIFESFTSIWKVWHVIITMMKLRWPRAKCSNVRMNAALMVPSLQNLNNISWITVFLVS